MIASSLTEIRCWWQQGSDLVVLLIETISNTSATQLWFPLCITNGNWCWKWFPDSMFLITHFHTVLYSIWILWGGFVSADGNLLTAMGAKAVLQIKKSSSDFRICKSPKQVHHIATSSLSDSCFWKRAKWFSFALPQPWHFYTLHSFLWLPAASQLLFSSYLPLLLQTQPIWALVPSHMHLSKLHP